MAASGRWICGEAALIVEQPALATKVRGRRGKVAKALIDMTDSELNEGARSEAENVQYAYYEFQSEIDRRTNTRLTLALVAATVVSTVLSAGRAASSPSS